MKVLFYCNAIGDDIKAKRRIEGDSPAATRKVVGLCRALEAAGVATEIVSMGRGKTGRFGWFGAETTTVQGIAVRYGPMLHVPLLSQLLTIAWLAVVAFTGLGNRKTSVHLFYNRLTAYLPALAILRLIGARRSVDIEDGTLDIASGERPESRARFGANADPRAFAKLIDNGALLANSFLKRQAYIVPTMAYFGCAEPVAVSAGNKRPHPRLPLKVLLSGSLEIDTGVGLFCDMLAILESRTINEKIEFVVCGHGSGLAMVAETVLRTNKVSLTVLGRQTFADYKSTVAHSDVGLSLKLAGGPFADTTFPSKTFEYVENGLLLVSTDISDVRAVFGDNAFYLQSDDPGELADVLLDVARDWPAHAKMAAQGSAFLHERYNELDVGIGLRNFLFRNAIPS